MRSHPIAHPTPLPSRGRERATRQVRTLSLFIISLFFLAITVQGAEPAPVQRAVVIAATGSVEFRPAGTSTWYPVATNHVLNPGDALRTAARSRAMLLLEDRSVQPVRQSSMLE